MSLKALGFGSSSSRAFNGADGLPSVPEEAAFPALPALASISSGGAFLARASPPGKVQQDLHNGPVLTREPGFTALIGVNLSNPAVRGLVGKVPGFGPLYERALAHTKKFAPGFAVWAPKSGAFLLLSSSSEAIGLGKGGPRVGYVTVFDPASKRVQLGVGRVDPLGVEPDGQFYFWNVRVAPDGVVRALKESVARPGKEVFVGSGIVGLAGVPQCRHGPANASLTTALGAGVGLRPTVVARNGDVYFKVGALAVPEPLMQLAISAAARLLSSKDALVCRDGHALRARLDQHFKDAKASVSGLARFSASQLASATALAAALAASMLSAPMQLGELR